MPHSQLAIHFCRCHFDFGWLTEQVEKNQSIDAMVSIFLALIFGLALLFHFARMGVRSQHSVAECCRHTGALLNFDGTFCLGRSAHTMQTYKGLFFFKSTFFAEGRPDGVRKYGKMRPKYGNIRPVWTRPDPKDFFWKSAPFFMRPSVHKWKLFQQLAAKDQGHRCAQTRVSSAEVSRCAHICPSSSL